MAILVDRMVGALREKPMRIGYVLAALVVFAVLYSLADMLPAPYEVRR
jgi:hypothetical protein